MNDELRDVVVAVTRELERLDEEHRHVAMESFVRLERLDPQTARLAVETLANRDDAGLWFAERIFSLSGDRHLRDF